MNNISNNNVENITQQKFLKPNFKNTASVPLTEENMMPEIELPAIYQDITQEKPETLVEKVKKVDMVGMFYPWIENPLLMGGTSYALIKGVDKFTEACGGEYEKSLLGKITRFGDNLENNLFKNKTIRKAGAGIKNGWRKFDSFLKRSSLLNALRFTPARPENQMPKSEMISQEVRFLHDFNEIAETLRLNPNAEKATGITSIFKNSSKDGSIKLTKIGLDKAEKEYLIKTFGKEYKKLPQEKLVNSILLKRLNYSSDDIARIIGSSDASTQVRNAILNKLGLTIDDIAKISAHPEEHVKLVKDAVARAGRSVRIGAGHYKWLGPFQPFERTISCDQISNKLKSVMEGAKTNTGKLLSKIVHKIHRGFTFGGGKLAMLFFIAPSLVQMMKSVKKADKDQKIGTAVNGTLESITWVFTFPLSIASTYALGGLRFAGMSKDKVKQFMAKTDAFNKLVDEGKLMDKSKYDAALKVLKEQRHNLRKVDKQNLFARMVKGITNFFYCDLNTIRSYKGENFLMNKVRQIPNFMKHFGLGTIRFLLCAFVIEAFYRNVIEKGIKAVFGNHYDYMKEEENIANKKQQKKFTKEDLQARLYEAQAMKVMGANAANQAATNEFSQAYTQEDTTMANQPAIENQQNNTVKQETAEKQAQEIQTQTEATPSEQIKTESQGNAHIYSAEEENLEPKYIPTEKQNLTATPREKRDNYTYIPSSENLFANVKKENFEKNKYIPAQTAAKITKTFDNSGLANALRKADKAEQKAIEILNGHFAGI